MSYGIYLYMQSVAGRGPGAALGVLAIAVVARGHLRSRIVWSSAPASASRRTTPMRRWRQATGSA